MIGSSLMKLADIAFFTFVLWAMYFIYDDRKNTHPTKFQSAGIRVAEYVLAWGGFVLGIIATSPSNTIWINILIGGSCWFTGIYLAAEVEKRFESNHTGGAR